MFRIIITKSYKSFTLYGLGVLLAAQYGRPIADAEKPFMLTVSYRLHWFALWVMWWFRLLL